MTTDFEPDTGHALDMSADGPGEAPAPRPGGGLTAPRIRVVPMPGSALAEALGPWAMIKASNPDLVAFDMTAFKHKWPPMDKAPFVWLTFLAWHACRRQGLIPAGLTFETFRDQADDVAAGDDGDDVVDPTPPDPGSGSPPSWR